ncbi:hypothetical protein C7M61_002785 [Candidozyma pseudohaemuli]|uniref:Uncharacterized protein n=1 Tax=Candidozyma pseudohaemuli TaxID=418784 RepID=A0A2P7YQH0_9ASCO|nr:hypothetical protein C7M61_002785 [[Candida] pseudohaemulonii]PSK38228.1 hypothetical protein C7M61_002785 [[Candida] pseudohaemulonii]
MSNDITRRLELRELNERAWTGELVYKLAAKQDLSLKKNTGFVKKLRTALNADQFKHVLKDVETLSLEKYLAEIVNPLFEGTMKVSKNDDILPTTEIVSALHQRLNLPFTPYYLSQVVNALVDKEQPDLIPKQRLLLKIITEFHLTGVAPSLQQCDHELLSSASLKLFTKHPDDPIIIPLLKDTLSYQFTKAYALPILISWLKRYAFIFDDGENSLLQSDTLNLVKQICNMYFEKSVKLWETLHKQKLALDLRNKKAMIRTGKVLDDIQQELEEKTKVVEALKNGCPVLAELLHTELPQLDLSSEPAANESDVVVKASTDDDAQGWWEDQRERNFYLKVPTAEEAVQLGSRDLQKKEYAKLTEGEMVAHWLEKLENATSEDDINKLTCELQTLIPQTKATQNRLLRFFLEVKKIDNVNLFARFLKINESLFPELITELIDALDRGFRSLIYRDVINFKNLSFFIELVKFKLIPTHVVFHKIRRLTLNIEGTNNADILLIFYERCGKFLLFEPDYQETTREMLSLLSKQSKSSRLSVNEKLSLRNMFLIVNSFTATKSKIKHVAVELSPIEDFITHMVRFVLWKNKSQLPSAFLSKINFQGCPEARNIFVELYLKPEELGLDKLHLYAKVLRRLGSDNVCIPLIIDTLTEKVIRGLELNDYRQNLARVAQMRFFAALFTASIIDFRCIIDLLYKVVTLGHANNLPLPNSRVDIDLNDNYFRISLCCALINNISFSKIDRARLLVGGTKSMEGFLTFFQYYVLTKKHPLPQEVSFAVRDVYSKMYIQPALDNPMLALSLLQKFNTEQKDAPKQDKSIFVESDHEEDEDEDEYDFSDDDDSSVGSDDELVDQQFEDEDEEATTENSDDENDELQDEDDLDDEETTQDLGQDLDEDEDGLAPWKQQEEDKRFADTIDAGIRDALQESLHISQARPKGNFKVPAPSNFVNATPENERSSNLNSPDGRVKFNFLSKKNSVKEMHLPSDNNFVNRVVREQAAQKANRDKIIRLINNMDQ